MPAKSLSTNGIAASAAPRMYLIYHEFARNAGPYSYSCAVDLFEEHIRLAARLQNSGEHRYHVPQVTFDDGHLSQYSSALPVLEKYGTRAIFFVIAGWVGNQSQTMGWKELRELHALGHQVQSHSMSHPMLTHCSDYELQQELSGPRREIEDKLGARVDAISIPNGRWDKRVLRACIDAGYQRVFTSDSWRRPEWRDGIQLSGRLNIPQSMSVERLEKLLVHNGRWKLLHDVQSRSKQLLKQVAGDRLYHRLWQSVTGARSADRG
ncbi:MAG: hypothetical protein DMG65_04225 [Candidatus Angelobacter sp. Gp1-AA117]|nr:MAG: hypothetical protein DMG65_04225 [Candidatus Angelobacter sp. Gp1-AA117]